MGDDIRKTESIEAYASFLMRVIGEARFLAYHGAPHERMHNLLDAAQDVPVRILHPNLWDEQVLFDRYFAPHDEKWPDGIELREAFEECRAQFP